MDTPDFEHGRVYFQQFGAERVHPFAAKMNSMLLQTIQIQVRQPIGHYILPNFLLNEKWSDPIFSMEDTTM